MLYVQATRPEKHNGGQFYEHEVHVDITGDPRGQSAVQLLAKSVLETIGAQHADYRMKIIRKYPKDSSLGYLRYAQNTKVYLVVRFVDKNHALRFKLSWI